MRIELTDDEINHVHVALVGWLLTYKEHVEQGKSITDSDVLAMLQDANDAVQ